MPTAELFDQVAEGDVKHMGYSVECHDARCVEPTFDPHDGLAVEPSGRREAVYAQILFLAGSGDPDPEQQ